MVPPRGRSLDGSPRVVSVAENPPRRQLEFPRPGTSRTENDPGRSDTTSQPRLRATRRPWGDAASQRALKAHPWPIAPLRILSDQGAYIAADHADFVQEAGSRNDMGSPRNAQPLVTIAAKLRSGRYLALICENERADRGGTVFTSIANRVGVGQGSGAGSMSKPGIEGGLSGEFDGSSLGGDVGSSAKGLPEVDGPGGEAI